MDEREGEEVGATEERTLITDQALGEEQGLYKLLQVGAGHKGIALPVGGSSRW